MIEHRARYFVLLAAFFGAFRNVFLAALLPSRACFFSSRQAFSLSSGFFR